MLFQPDTGSFIPRQDFLYQPPKSSPMIVVLDVAELMHHHVFQAGQWNHRQTQRKIERIPG